MTEKQYAISYKEGSDWTELPDSHQRLILAAIEASNHAYAPYSNFKVGAAMLTDSGTIITGNNQENAAYPMCNCAEQVAIQKAFSGDSTIKVNLFAVYAQGGQDDLLAAPCGACRQVLIESADRSEQDFPIMLVARNKHFRIFQKTKDLLPFNFGVGDLT